MNVRLLLAGIAALAMTACAGVTDVIQKRESLYQAAPVHPASVNPGPDAYRKALAAARTAYDARLGSAHAVASPEELIDAGIVAANSNCRAWLAAVSAAEQRWKMGETNASILMSLITGILAAANVHHDVILAYGLGSAAYTEYSQGFLANVLSMADYDTQTKVREAMGARAAQLRTQSATMSYPQAVDAIEEYSQLCTPQAAKALSRSAMTAVTTTVAASGAITAAPTPAATITSSYQKDDSGERITAYWLPGGNVDKANEVRIHAWLGAKGVLTSIPYFSHAQVYALARKQMVEDLKLPPAGN